MKQSMTWIVCVSALSLAACVSNANNCPGWQQISLKSDTAVYLAGNDTKAGTGIAGHNAYGKKNGVLVISPMDPNANPAHRFNELPKETQDFLSQMREDEIENLKDGLH